MFKTIRTSEKNRERISDLTSKFQLGTENVIARLALAYSLSKDKKFTLKDLKDSKGKEYSSRVLFGDYITYYIALICQHYDVYKSDENIGKYIKLHIDDGIEQLSELTNKRGLDFILEEVESGLTSA